MKSLEEIQEWMKNPLSVRHLEIGLGIYLTAWEGDHVYPERETPVEELIYIPAISWQFIDGDDCGYYEMSFKEFKANEFDLQAILKEYEEFIANCEQPEKMAISIEGEEWGGHTAASIYKEIKKIQEEMNKDDWNEWKKFLREQEINDELPPLLTNMATAYLRLIDAIDELREEIKELKNER